MPSINTYYSQALYDEMTEAAKTVFGSEDPKRIDKFIKACLKYAMKHQLRQSLKKLVKTS